ncbi:MAG TPA: FumA C-terminus/TtdB family hydratase beta subunit [Anaerolineales bacterium]|nr:FumA C-terminus/TtdB family hydratase beta subunit [Anaerolineales bacterium]HMX18975.1 FumA C-terminus/TtdB family hydratase beta subunit [Anaerolineales bacterium]HMX74368.1 FumA C-terminus/TtdB family hydratase beta subunit [Anaerolineales bacterium]HMZ42607.1 FumA C-terminus/TtdB family hydratase beta subunit [Anaerolineales bacterium]HNA54113.1 FumA C-terminus/TtdB family hydratase beta subunit [Anaerolineales bacterium]
MKQIKTPITDEVIRELKVGDAVSLSGMMVTGRDAAHKWMIETFIKKTRAPQGDDLQVYEELKKLLAGSVIYHCGPVVTGLDTKEYKIIAAGPTTSIREEPYQADVMKHFNVKGVIGKGGMGAKTLKGCQDTPGVYFHAIGGAASFLAQTVKKVHGVFKLDFGVPEAMWVIEVQDFPVVVTMDSHGGSQHSVIDDSSKKVLDDLLAQPY